MNDTGYLQLLRKNLQDLNESKKWLERSYNACQKISIKDKYTAEEFDTFENLTSRFARTCDFIINKVFRSIDRVELENSGTMIDVINRAHKKELIDNVQEIRTIKELRNEIAHEYSNRELVTIFKDVFQFTPILLATIENIINYCGEKYTN